jgi:hypothetical protein
MSVEQSTADVSPWVQLFQKAHQKITLLERLDEQVIQIFTKRQELHDELRELQTQINEEFNQRIKLAGEPPARLLSAIASGAAHHSDGPAKPTAPILEHVTPPSIGRTDSTFHEPVKERSPLLPKA